MTLHRFSPLVERPHTRPGITPTAGALRCSGGVVVPLGHVGRAADPLAHPSRRVAHRHSTHEEGAIGAVGAAQPILLLVAAARGDGLGPDARRGRAVLRMNGIEPAVAPRLVRALAAIGLPQLHVPRRAAGRHRPRDAGGRRRERAEAILAGLVRYPGRPIGSPPRSGPGAPYVGGAIGRAVAERSVWSLSGRRKRAVLRGGATQATASSRLIDGEIRLVHRLSFASAHSSALRSRCASALLYRVKQSSRNGSVVACIGE